MKQERLLTMAKHISKKSDHHNYKVGCVIAKGNRVIGKGFNTLKTHTKSPHPFKSIHAEFMAVLSAEYDIKGATVYVFREQKSGKWSISRPCKSCWQFLIECGAKRVVYSYEGSFKEEEVL
jgi:pyrimidine deaminase RibD-like protein